MNTFKSSVSRPLLCITSLLLSVETSSAFAASCRRSNSVWADVRMPEQLTITSWNTPIQSPPSEAPAPVTGLAATSFTLTVDHDENDATPALAVTEIPDDFFGSLDLTVDGLARGQTVIFEKFRVLPGGLPMVLQQSHLITDGAAQLVGEVYNLNLPTDAIGVSDGRIIAQLDSYEPSAASIVGEYLFRISNPPPADPGMPGTNFSIDLPVSVVSAEEDAAQGLTGKVLDAATDLPIPGALVVKMWPLSGYADILSGTSTDDSGEYLLPSEERNEFDFAATKQGYIGRFGPGTGVNLEEDTFLNYDIYLEKGTRLISGTLKDAATNLPMAGVELFLSTPPVAGVITEQFFTVTWTDEAGNFSTMVNEGIWNILVRNEITAPLGYVTSSIGSLSAADTTGGNDVTGLDVNLKRGTSLIHGTLSSTSGPPIPGVEMMAINDQTREATYGVTDRDGRYRLAVTPGRWEVFPFSFSVEDSDHTGVINQEIQVTEDRQSVEYHVKARPKMAELFGVVSDQEENPIGRLRLLAFNRELSNNEGVFQSTFETDGEYCIFLAEGDWLLFPSPSEAARRAEKLIFIDQPTISVDLADPGFDGEFEVDIDVIRVTEATPEIELTVTDQNTNAPLADLTLHAYASIDGVGYHSYCATGTDGIAHIPVISEGSPMWTIHISVEATRALGKKEIEDVIQINATGALTQIAVTTEDFDTEPLPNSTTILLNEDGSRIFSVDGATNGRGYLLEASPDLKNWFGMGRVRAVEGEIRLIDKSLDTSGRRFYRAGAE